MSRTNSRIESSQPNTDAFLKISPEDIIVSAAAAADAVLTRNAAGDWSINQIASKTNIYGFPISKLLFRTGLAPDLQEQFGTAAGVAGPTAVANTGGPNPVEGRPPFTGSTQLTPPTGFKAKGISVLDLTLIYQISTNPLTAHTCRMDKTVYANNLAPVISAILATGVNGLATAVNAQPFVTKVVVAPGFLVTDNSEIIFEVSVQTAAACTYKLYGAIAHVSYNLN